METAGALFGLVVGVLLAFAGGEALTRGSRALLAPAALGLAAFVAVVASAIPEFAFAMRAAQLDLPGAAIGAVAGSFIANAFVAAMVALGGYGESEAEVRGGRTFSVASAIAAGALLFVAFDGQISRTEGGMMLAGAVLVAIRAARIDMKSDDPAGPRTALPVALLLVMLGVLLAGGGTWLALREVQAWAQGRPDGDLVAGLTMLGAGAALPEVAAAFTAAGQGRGARGFVNVTVGTSLTLFGAVGAAALIRPLVVSDAFFPVPAVTVAVAAVVLMIVAAARRRVHRAFVLAGFLAWMASLAAFAQGS
jgi:cation:H+ antiporter